MANPTTNFGWQMPTATDLVTDLPADFDVFGQAVDTDFVGLKGGTTGQVLAKASGTDLDFVWSADAAGMTNPMTTTGDTIYSSSGSTPARLGIGSTGQVLTVAAGVPSWSSVAAIPTNGQTQVLTSQGTTSSSFTDLATVQAVTVTTGTRALIILSALATTPSPGDTSRIRMGFAVSGASTIAASNDYALMWEGNNIPYYDFGGGTSFIITGLTAGSNTFTAKFSSDLGANALWEDRRLAVIDMGS
jgi:hypothetical protein